jgi:CRISPR type I-E-associated protein CasB/Cse2
MTALPYLDFRKEPAASILWTWHEWLLSDRGARAALRRARALDDVWMEEAYSRLRMPLMEHYRVRDEALARAALAVAEVKENNDRSFAACAAAATQGGRATVTAARMRLTLGAEDPDEFLRLLRGLLAMIAGSCDLRDLADLVIAWHSPESRSKARRRVILDYYAHAPRTTAA